MGDSIVTVTTPRSDSSLLVSLDALKSELQVTGSDQDEYLSDVLLRACQGIETYCNRVFAPETVSELFRLDPCARPLNTLVLARSPVITLTSVTEDGSALSASDYEIDKGAGILYRLSGDGRIAWSASKITVVYSAGYATTPGVVKDGIFELVKQKQAARTRDPALRSENLLEGLYSYTLFNGENLKSVLDCVSGLDRYIKRTVA